MLAVLAALVLISAIVEPLEFALVALVNGGVTTDQNIYLSVRNQPGFLAAKLPYNKAAAFVGGFVAAWLARRAPAAHGRRSRSFRRRRSDGQWPVLRFDDRLPTGCGRT